MQTNRSSLRMGFDYSTLATALVLYALFGLPGEVTGQSSDGQVTFTRDVAPILQANCEVCHRPGEIGPMALRTYEEVRPWAQVIKVRVESRLMPPWHIDKTVGIQEFKNDISLEDEEIQTIARWVDAGAPMGDPADMPPPVAWLDDSGKWQLESEFGPPDLVITTEDYTVVANGQDQWFDSVVQVDGLTEERWIRAVEIRPSNPEAAYVFHHGNSALVYEDEGGEEVRAALVGAAAGMRADIFPSDSGKRIRPGSTLETDIHYFPIGREIPNASLDVGLYFYPRGETPRFETRGSLTHHADNTKTTSGPLQKVSEVEAGGVRAVDIFIPPHGTQMLRGVYMLQQPARIHSIRGHMHMRGKYQAMEAVYPDGRREVLSKINWQHTWHTNFNYADHVQPLLPKGTALIFTSWFDNTANNPHNPDPDQIVVFGRRSVDEMSHIWVGITYLEQDEFEQLLVEREELLEKMSLSEEGEGAQ